MWGCQLCLQAAGCDDKGRWTVRDRVGNLTGERDSIIGFDVSAFYGTSQESYTRPRAYGLQVRYSL